MTIHSIDVVYQNKIYQVILEDGLVSFINPDSPSERISLGQPPDLVVTTMDGARQMGLQMIRRYCEALVLSD